MKIESILSAKIKKSSHGSSNYISEDNPFLLF
ncbi:uncharacterized protein METZ01_LOCUS159495 [marine metagenome]|uniref:Uncharacterized protein n=1 Tax=marine metagenome TaxID=408172 RepID=A0A382AZB9_9ZZZZ